ncbi:MAG TPA: hypothetical protein VFB45_15375 [Pseudolabrys sp.]|nr:hypothetical protein [Pseudolabrys sp.]
MKSLLASLLISAALIGAANAQGAPTQSSPLAAQSLSIPTTAGGTALVAANPTRRFLKICNAGATNPVWICPAGVTPAANAAGCFVIAPVASNVTSCDPFPAIPGLNTAAWNAIATGGATNVTVWEYP